MIKDTTVLPDLPTGPCLDCDGNEIHLGDTCRTNCGDEFIVSHIMYMTDQRALLVGEDRWVRFADRSWLIKRAEPVRARSLYDHD